MSEVPSFSTPRPVIVRLLFLVVVFSLAAAMLVPLTAMQEARAWSTDPVVNTPICTAAGDQDSPVMISDGSGGAIIVWQDLRGGKYDIYAQRVSASGAPQWTSNGVAVCTAPNGHAYLDVTSDGSGGAIITWMDGRSGNADVYAQRLNAAGNPQWEINGVVVCNAINQQVLPGLIADDSGGAVVVWTDNRSGNCDIYAQRLNPSGAPQWIENGVALCISAGEQILTGGDEDGSGGAIVAWQDNRWGNWDVYAQWVSSSGAPLTDNGTAVCWAVGDQGLAGVIADGSGGATVVWADERGGSVDIYAQKLNQSGATRWTANGVAVCTSPGPQIVTGGDWDGSGGAIIAWMDGRSGNYDVYAQRVTSSGTSFWTANGVAVGSGAGDQVMPTLIGDGSGGAIVAWEDSRNGNNDIYAQKLDASGTHQWADNGVAICTAADEQQSAELTTDGAGGAILAWEDYRSGTSLDIYSQKVNSSGHPGSPPAQPTNSSPANLAIGVSLTPTLQASAFSDSDAGDTQAASQWQVTKTPGDYSSPVFDGQTDNASSTSVVIPSGKLDYSTTYYWHVRYKDNHGSWSNWSAETSFATQNRVPNQPANLSPAGGAPAVSVTPTLQSSAFSDPDTGDTHTASQWRMTATAGVYSSPVFDSGTDNVNLIQIALPSGKLNGNTLYYWKVRHQDSHGDWSEWSTETSFTTQNLIPNQPGIASPLDGVSKVKLTATLESSVFSDPDAGDSHAASQWRITATAGDYSTPVFDSGTDSANLVQMAVPSGKLKGNTTYYWQVRHQDSHGDWSEWSEESSFTTRKSPQTWIWIVVGLAAVAIPAGGIGIWRLRSAKNGGSAQV